MLTFAFVADLAMLIIYSFKSVTRYPQLPRKAECILFRLCGTCPFQSLRSACLPFLFIICSYNINDLPLLYDVSQGILFFSSWVVTVLIFVFAVN